MRGRMALGRGRLRARAGGRVQRSTSQPLITFSALQITAEGLLGEGRRGANQHLPAQLDLPECAPLPKPRLTRPTSSAAS